MSARAVVAVFDPDEKRLADRRKQVERLANEVQTHIRVGMQPRAVILCAGSRVVFALPETQNFYRLCALKSSLLVGVYDAGVDPERVRNDLECTLSEYFEGRHISTNPR